MQFVGEMLELLHLIGFAALLGGALVQLREPAPEVNVTMLAGAWIEVVAGGALFALAVTGPGPVNWAQLIISSLINLFLLVVAAKNRKYADVPRGLLLLVIALAVGNAALTVFWGP